MVFGQEHLRLQGGLRRRAAKQDRGPPAGSFGCRGEAIEAAQDTFVNALRLGRHGVVLVVQRDVVEDVLGTLAVHPFDTVRHDGRCLVGERRVVGGDVGDGTGQHQGLAVIVLKSLA